MLDMDEDIARTVLSLQRRKAGLKGGPARRDALSPERRSEIARRASEVRWGVKKDAAPKKRAAAKLKEA